LRVSTERQGAVDLGIDAKHLAVQRYADMCGGNILNELVEVESGKRSDRPILEEAIALCRTLTRFNCSSNKISTRGSKRWGDVTQQS
jgi:DNA invertase Pin-like site-specific DNA recombinase